MVLLAVEGFAAVGGQLFRQIHIIGAIFILGIGKAAGAGLLQLGHMLLRQAPQHQGNVLGGGEFPDGLHRRGQGPLANGENKGGLTVTAQLSDHPATGAGHQLLMVLVPKIDFAKVNAGAGAVLLHYQPVHPGLVLQRKVLEFQHINRFGCKQP